MKLEWVITPDDEQRYRDFIQKYEARPLVKERLERNVQRLSIDISINTVWARVVSCLLTTQQKSGKGSRVQQFIQNEKQLFSFPICSSLSTLELVAKEALTKAGLRRSERISEELHHAMSVFKTDWQDIEAALINLNEQPSAKAERNTAQWIQEKFKGFGPKQSRNLLQWLGLSQYEIPLDSRVMKILKQLNFPAPLSSTALSDETYYCFVQDGLHKILARIEILPCIFDACAFASLEHDQAQ